MRWEDLSRAQNARYNQHWAWSGDCTEYCCIYQKAKSTACEHVSHFAPRIGGICSSHSSQPKPNPPQTHRGFHNTIIRLRDLESERIEQLRRRIPCDPNRLPTYWLRSNLWKWERGWQRYCRWAEEGWAWALGYLGDFQIMEWPVGFHFSRGSLYPDSTTDNITAMTRN